MSQDLYNKNSNDNNNKHLNTYNQISCLICNKSPSTYEKHICELRRDQPNLIISNNEHEYTNVNKETVDK